MTGKPYPPFPQQWDTIEVMITAGGRVENSDIVAALRNATTEIDDIITLLHTCDVTALLQLRLVAPEDKVVGKLFDALEALILKPLSVVPAIVQRHIANLLEPPPKSAGRPKLKPTDMRLLQRNQHKVREARKDVAEMDELLARHGSEKAALEAFAKSKGKTPEKRQVGITVPAARRRYMKSKALVDEASL